MSAVKGKKIIYLFREESKSTTDDAFHIAYATENERSIDIDSDTQVTKDGSIVTPGNPEVSISATSLLKEGDEKMDELEDAACDNRLMEIWEANLARPCTTDTYTLTADTDIVQGKTYYTRSGSGTSESPYVYTPVQNPVKTSIGTYYEKTSEPNGKYKGKYFQGYISSYQVTSNAEDYVEVSLEFSVNGSGKRGDITVDASTVDDADYVFADTQKTGA